MMIHKHIYSTYQVIKIVNCRQPIQIPLKYFDNYFHSGMCTINSSLILRIWRET